MASTYTPPRPISIHLTPVAPRKRKSLSRIESMATVEQKTKRELFKYPDVSMEETDVFELLNDDRPPRKVLQQITNDKEEIFILYDDGTYEITTRKIMKCPNNQEYALDNVIDNNE
jgi:hypothetical protein